MKKIILTLLFCVLSYFPLEAEAFLVSIEGDIDMGLPYYIERSIETAENSRADVIIFDIDTFGGRVDAATRIKDAILSSKIPTIAFINRRAISAGALISLSCDSIYMTSGATIGAATAVDQTGKKTSEKVISYMREEMASTAEATGRSREIAAGMVDDELEIPFMLTSEGDTLTTDDIEGFKEFKLITLSTKYALLLGIADYEFETLNQVLEHLNEDKSDIVTVESSWSEDLVRFLTSPTVAPLLMTLGFLGLLFEVKSPGFGFPGAAGLFLLALFFGSHLLVGLADIFELILLAAGVILVILEIFVIPGFGVAGISGGGLILWGMYQMLVGDYPNSKEVHDALLGLNIGFIGAVIAAIFSFKILIKSKFYKRVIPITAQNKSEGYSVSKGFESLLGQTGIAISDIRPAGKIDLGGKHYQVMSRGDYIEKGSEIIVDGVDENQLIVKKIV